MKVTFKHTLNIGARDFLEKIHFDRQYNVELYRSHLKMKGFEIERLDLLDDRCEKRTRVTPQQDAPAFVRRVVNGELSYTEEGAWRRDSTRYTFKTETSVLSERIAISGDLVLTDVGPSRCERVATLDIQVKVPLVGGKLEQFIADQLRHNFDRGAEFTNQWIKEKGLGGG